MLSRDALEGAVLSLMEAEIGLLRRERLSEPLEADTAVRGGEIDLNPLERRQTARAVMDMFHIHETGFEEALLGVREAGEWVNAVERSMHGGTKGITFRSSGSWGEPRAYTHEHGLLAQETAYWANVLPSFGRVAAMVPLHHIYGFLWAAMLPSLRRVPVVRLRRGKAEAAFAQLAEGDLAVSHPQGWKAMAQCGRHFPKCVTGVVSGGPADADVIEALREGAGLGAMWEIYGASETGGVGFRTSPREPFALADYWSRTHSGLLRQRPDGTAAGYDLPDVLEWRGERQFLVRRRIDGAVQVAGINVYPQHIGALIRRNLLVRDCVVRLMGQHEGDRLKAFVALAPGVDATPEVCRAIEETLRGEVTGLEMPQSWTYGREMPVSGMGKPADWRQDDRGWGE